MPGNISRHWPRRASVARTDRRAATGWWTCVGRGCISIVVVPERLDNDQFSPCAYIRLLQPLDHPAIGGGFDIVLADAAEALCYRADIVATQRYAVPDLAAAAALGRALPANRGNPALRPRRRPAAHPARPSRAPALRPKARVVQRLLRDAEAVFVSTPALAASLAPVRRDAVVVPNGLDERLWGDLPGAFRRGGGNAAGR